MPWLDLVDVVLQSWFAGIEVGNATANIIGGEVNPSGRLPMTFTKCIEDVPVAANFPANENLDIYYAEGGCVGYRALRGEKPSPAPVFVFGHGLLYAEFKYSSFRLQRKVVDEFFVKCWWISRILLRELVRK
jgi:beta-glucosidase